MLRVCPVISFPSSFRGRSHRQPPCTWWTLPPDPDGPPAGIQASCALCPSGRATISTCLHRTKRSNLAREARAGAQFPRDPRTGRDSTSPSHPFGGHCGNWRHCADRHCRGQGAPRRELGSQWQRDGATSGSVDLNLHLAFHHALYVCAYDNDSRHIGTDHSNLGCSAGNGPDDIGANDNDDQSSHHDNDSSRRAFWRDVALTATMSTLPTPLAQRSFRAIGTTATVVVCDPHRVDSAESILRDELDAIDLACSRFRPDSELEYLHSRAGTAVTVSPLLFDALEVAVAVAERTHGAVDPTVGNAMSTLGYDRDFDQIRDQPQLPPTVLGPVVGYRAYPPRLRGRGRFGFPGEFASTSDRRQRHLWRIGPRPGSPTSSIRAFW